MRTKQEFQTDMPPLVLASTSPFRAELLQRLGIPFERCNPDIDETPLAHEDAHAMTLRLSEAKAAAVQRDYPQHLIIASDQCALFAGQIIGKPAKHAQAVEQLRQFSGQTVEFLTGLTLLNSATQQYHSDVVTYRVTFRSLSTAQIERYLQKERPYNCAGSFKSEGLGITLFARMSGDDPNALIGLPLIRLTDFLLAEGVELP